MPEQKAADQLSELISKSSLPMKAVFILDSRDNKLKSVFYWPRKPGTRRAFVTVVPDEEAHNELLKIAKFNPFDFSSDERGFRMWTR